MTHPKLRTLLILGAASLLNCHGTSGDLGPAPKAVEQDFVQTNGVKTEVNAEVDILFVIDDSGSMKPHIRKLQENINRFVESLDRISIIDFHIGVLSIYDSYRYGKVNLATDEIIKSNRPDSVNLIARDGKTQLFDRLGHLKLLTVPAGKEDLLANQPARFVVRAPGYMEILKSTLNVGIREYQRVTTNEKEAQGPEFEELFTPVKAALTEPRLSKVNKGFHRPNSFLTVVLVTDADESKESDVTESELLKFLTKLKGRGNFMVVGIINPSKSDPSVGECARDPEGAPKRIERLIHDSNGVILNMCKSNYGDDLARLSQVVRDRTVQAIQIPLGNAIPEIDRLKVYYSTDPQPPFRDEDLVPYSNVAGFTYDRQTNSVWIHGAAQWATKPGAKIWTSVESVNTRRANAKCVAGC